MQAVKRKLIKQEEEQIQPFFIPPLEVELDQQLSN